MTDATRTTYTLELLGWSPWLDRATETSITDVQRERITAFIGNVSHSAYLDVLANDFASLQARALVHRHVYESNEPEPTANRELGATVASRINGCVFCASVHARMYAHASKRREVIERFLADGLDADLPPLERAIVDLSAKLTRDPESVTAADLEPLRAHGLDDLALLDILNYTAFFANANRLMLTLGEPTAATTSRAG